MKPKFIDLYSDIADRIGQMSLAKRAQVGAIIVKDDTIISYGYNGMPRDWPNDCEINGVTRPEVLHAESNAIAKLARGSASGLAADMFVSYSPCLDCAKLIAQTGIKRVWYRQSYRDSAGIDFLRQCKIEVIKK